MLFVVNYENARFGKGHRERNTSQPAASRHCCQGELDAVLLPDAGLLRYKSWMAGNTNGFPVPTFALLRRVRLDNLLQSVLLFIPLQQRILLPFVVIELVCLEVVRVLDEQLDRLLRAFRFANRIAQDAIVEFSAVDGD